MTGDPVCPDCGMYLSQTWNLNTGQHECPARSNFVSSNFVSPLVTIGDKVIQHTPFSPITTRRQKGRKEQRRNSELKRLRAQVEALQVAEVTQIARNLEVMRALERAERAEAELAALRERERWIPVEERLPEVDGMASDHVLILGEMGGVTIASYVPETWRVDDYVYTPGWYLPNHAFPIVSTVTHWRPLPELPEGGA
jgi:hypothetical protein